MPYKTWSVGEEVLAADFNDYIQKQIVATFDDVTDRTEQLPSPVEGQVCYLKNTNALYIYDGTNWTKPAHVGWGIYSGPHEFTPMTTLATGAQNVPGSSFILPVAGRQYAIHATASIEQEHWIEPSNRVTFGIVANTTVGTYVDQATARGGGDTHGDCHAFHCYAQVTATVTNQIGNCVVNSQLGMTSVVRDGRVYVADLGLTL